MDLKTPREAFSHWEQTELPKINTGENWALYNRYKRISYGLQGRNKDYAPDDFTLIKFLCEVAPDVYSVKVSINAHGTE